MSILDTYHQALRAWCEQNLAPEDAAAVTEAAKHAWSAARHGDFPRWLQCVDGLPAGPAKLSVDRGAVAWTFSDKPEVDVDNVRRCLQGLHPWRKGPWNYFGVRVDAEWQSDWKWDRLKNAVCWNRAQVLDVGCGNGYYAWRMIAAGAARVIGVEPTPLMGMQALAAARYGGLDRHLILPLRDETVRLPAETFDVVVSAGVLYHHASPIEHLRRLFGWLRPGGTLLLETLVAPDPPGLAVPDADDLLAPDVNDLLTPGANDLDTLIFPRDRYAQMRNVWFLPSTGLLEKWLHRCGWDEVAVLDPGTPTTTAEQRSTPWMKFQSL
ncbi:MAG: DUF1698 domain-containing protein, partial [Planctomycetota bacterium]